MPFKLGDPLFKYYARHARNVTYISIIKLVLPFATSPSLVGDISFFVEAIGQWSECFGDC